MKRGTDRRRWLFGVLGALFGTGAARALQRWLSERKPPRPALLSRTMRAEAGGEWTGMEEVDGRVVIEYDPASGSLRLNDPASGSLRLTRCDANGRVVERQGQGLRAATLALPARIAEGNKDESDLLDVKLRESRAVQFR